MVNAPMINPKLVKVSEGMFLLTKLLARRMATVSANKNTKMKILPVNLVPEPLLISGRIELINAPRKTIATPIFSLLVIWSLKISAPQAVIIKGPMVLIRVKSKTVDFSNP